MLTKFTHRKHENSTKTTHILAGYVYIYDIPARSKYPDFSKKLCFTLNCGILRKFIVCYDNRSSVEIKK